MFEAPVVKVSHPYIIHYTKELNKTKAYITTGANNIGQPQTNILSLFDEDQRIPSSDKIIHHQVTATNPFDPNKFIINNSSLLSANAVKMV